MKPHWINPDLGLPVIIDTTQRKPSRMERLGETLLDYLLGVGIPVAIVAIFCAWVLP